MKKHNWMKYGRQGEKIILTIRDFSEKKLEEFKCNDEKSYQRAVKAIKEKYGWEFKSDLKEEKTEMDWLKEMSQNVNI